MKKMNILIFVALVSPFAMAAPVVQGNGDNTVVNKRDRMNSEVTADQAGMSQADTDVTRRIRKDLMKDKSLSTYAHNIKIISLHGVVTMKGPVRTAADETKVLNYARAAVGPTNVVNEVTIVPDTKN